MFTATWCLPKRCKVVVRCDAPAVIVRGDAPAVIVRGGSPAVVVRCDAPDSFIPPAQPPRNCPRPPS